LAAIAAIASVAAARIDVDAGNKLTDYHRQGAAVLSGETVGALRPASATVPRTPDGPAVVAIPMADGILPLAARPACLAVRAVCPVAS